MKRLLTYAEAHAPQPKKWREADQVTVFWRRQRAGWYTSRLGHIRRNDRTGLWGYARVTRGDLIGPLWPSCKQAMRWAEQCEERRLYLTTSGTDPSGAVTALIMERSPNGPGSEPTADRGA